MKTGWTLWTGIGLIALSPFSAHSLDSDKKTGETRSDTPALDAAATDSLQPFSFPMKTSVLLGMEVTNLQNEKIGKVDEIALELGTGRVIQVILSSGGVLGVGDKTWAVPPGIFSMDPASKTLRIDVEKDRYKKAPAFDSAQWNDSFQTAQVNEVYQAYGQKPYWSGSDAAKSSTDAAAGLVKTERASKLVRMPVLNDQDEKLGVVDNLVVDLPMGRVVYVIISSGGFLGLGDALSAVPPSAFKIPASHDALRLSADKASLSKAPYFKNGEWPNFTDPSYASKVYRSYSVEPYFEADNTARNVRDRREGQLTPLDQGNSPEDIELTRKIRREIQASNGLSVNAKNVKVITLNGKVTLRGPVENEQERKTISDIATRLASPGVVENQLETLKDAPAKGGRSKDRNKPSNPKE